MSGARLTTGIGIAVGGIGGALVALMGAPKAPPSAQAPSPPPPARTAAQAPPVAPAPADLASAAATAAIAAVTPPSAAAPSAAVPGAATAPTPSAATAAPAPAASPATPVAVAPLELPTTVAGLLKAEMLCDQKKDFDECARAAISLETGSTGPADPEQGKRFRKIALTHLVTQCEAGVPHACFVLAAKYRAGAELPSSPKKAETLEQRGLELCKKRTGPECPPQ